MGYFHNTLDSEAGISGDDLNRRHRESRLGYAAPSADWANCKQEIRCVFDDQVVNRQALDCNLIYVHSNKAHFQLPNGKTIKIV